MILSIILSLRIHTNTRVYMDNYPRVCIRDDYTCIRVCLCVYVMIIHVYACVCVYT